MNKNRTYRIILSGGGTGGHIYPAIAVADKTMKLFPGSEVLFVGAKGKMEMEKVPQAGYRIEGLPVAGLHRRITLRNLVFPFRLFSSISKAKSILNNFKPDAVAGFGGYASGPILWVASGKKIPSVIQEQNSFAGMTNKLLSRRVNRVCVAWEGMEKYFPAEKIILTGNPVREDIFDLDDKKALALDHFGFTQHKKTILVLGGSLGARSVNRTIFNSLSKFLENDIQLIWQAGKIYISEYREKLRDHDMTHIRLFDFIKEMDMAYAASDLVIARAGALSVSELCAAGKACILVPSPNVAEDHQTRNAENLAGNSAAVMISDRDAPELLADTALKLIRDEGKLKELSVRIRKYSRHNAAEEIVRTITGLLN